MEAPQADIAHKECLFRPGVLNMYIATLLWLEWLFPHGSPHTIRKHKYLYYYS